MLDLYLIAYHSAVLGLILAVGSLTVYLAYPVVFLQLYFRFWVLYSGMRVKYTQIDGLTICYGEKGKRNKSKPSMLLIHGFTADKFMWAPLVKNLSSDTHVVAVDLPGHGDSDIPGHDHDLSPAATLKTMRQLIELTGLNSEPYHMVGMSMGGAMAGLYAARFPDEIHSVTLICPAMKTPVESPFWKNLNTALETPDVDVEKSCSLLFPTTPKEVQYMLDYVQYNKMWVPHGILQGIVKFRMKYYPFQAKVFQAIVKKELHTMLQDACHKITSPSQVIWGESDQILDVSGAEILQELLPNCQKVDLIPRCGHSISTDRPGAMTKAILNFRKHTKADR